METKDTQDNAGQVRAIATNLIDLWDNHRTEDQDPAEIKELAESIAKVGLLQPVLVRPGKKPGRFQLIAGFRRFAAMKLNDATHAQAGQILANVRDLDDVEAFDAQMTENLQRKDVSPMDEAKAFTAMLESGRYTMADIAARIAKAESYVAQRLKLMDLIKPLQTALNKGTLPIGHAMELAKLAAADQEELAEGHTGVYSDGWPHLADLKADIERNYLGNLSAAPWKKDDATLVPAAGPCTTCPKRSGANPSLFPDIKQKDRCSDRTCYANKSATFIELRVLEAIEKEPDTVFIRHAWGQDPAAQVLKILDDNGVKVLKEHNNFRTAEKGKGKLRGIWLNGDKAGKTEDITLTKASGSAAATTKVAGKESSGIDYKLAINGIKTRTARFNELESQRTHTSLKGSLDECEAMSTNTKPLAKLEMAAAVTMFFEDSHAYAVLELVDDAVARKKGKDTGSYVYDRLRVLDDEKLEALFYRCLRMEMADRLTKRNNTSPEEDNDARAVEDLAVYYMPDLTKELYATKKATTDKRNASAAKRIAELEKKAAALKPKKATPAKKKAATAAGILDDKGKKDKGPAKNAKALQEEATAMAIKEGHIVPAKVVPFNKKAKP